MRKEEAALALHNMAGTFIGEGITETKTLTIIVVQVNARILGSFAHVVWPMGAFRDLAACA